jgi:hypothetical protein
MIAQMLKVTRAPKYLSRKNNRDHRTGGLCIGGYMCTVVYNVTDFAERAVTLINNPWDRRISAYECTDIRIRGLYFIASHDTAL